MAKNKINGKVYIGQTINNLKDRNRLRKYGKSKFDNAFRKYGEEGFDWVILETCQSIEELNDRESYWIEYYNSTDNSIGYNLKGGGGNAYLTKEVKEKISNAQKGELNHMYGKKYSKNGMSRPVVDLLTNTYYESVTQAFDKTKDTYALKNIDVIYKNCKGSLSETIKFRYVDEDGSIIYNKRDLTPTVDKSKSIICLNTLEEFKNVGEVMTKYNLSKRQVIGRCEYNSSHLSSLRVENRGQNNLVFIFKDDFDKWKSYVEENPTYDINFNRRLASKKCCKKVRSITDNIVFDSLKEASEYYTNKGFRGISSPQIINHIKNNSIFRYAKHLKFEYV